jgi:hypothetical protein
LIYAVCGLVFVTVVFLCYFRLRYKRLPFQKSKEEHGVHPDFAPKKSSDMNLRLKLLEQEKKSRDRYTQPLEPNMMNVLMQESMEAKLRDERDAEEGGALVVAAPHSKSKKIDSRHGEEASAPPHPIASLVRSGVLMPPRSSVVDGANRKMLTESGGAGAPEKLEIQGGGTVAADFRRTNPGEADWEVSIKVSFFFETHFFLNARACSMSSTPPPPPLPLLRCV